MNVQYILDLVRDARRSAKASGTHTRREMDMQKSVLLLCEALELVCVQADSRTLSNTSPIAVQAPDILPAEGETLEEFRKRVGD